MPDDAWNADDLMASAVTVNWPSSHRLVHSRFPPVLIFDTAQSLEDLEILAETQGITKDRIQQDLGRIHLVAEEDQLFGHGTSPVMAAFCYLSPVPTRFSSGAYGVYYAADSIECAVAEVSHHQQRFLWETDQPASTITLRCYTAAIQKPLVDIRALADVHEPDSYAMSQMLASEVRDEGAWGLLYKSVRSPGGQCAAVLRPPAIKTPVIQSTHVHLQWNGTRIDSWYTSNELQIL